MYDRRQRRECSCHRHSSSTSLAFPCLGMYIAICIYSSSRSSQEICTYFIKLEKLFVNQALIYISARRDRWPYPLPSYTNAQAHTRNGHTAVQQQQLCRLKPHPILNTPFNPMPPPPPWLFFSYQYCHMICAWCVFCLLSMASPGGALLP